MTRFVGFLRVEILLAFLLAGISVPAAAAPDWPVIPKEQLTMKEHPLAPGAHAVILHLEVFTDYGQQLTQVAGDIQPFESHYTRIKILTEWGKKYADVEIPYFDHEYFTLTDVEARTVQPDGTAVEFKGQVFDKTLYRRRGVRILVKTFTLPEVRVGSIIEYRYKFKWHRWVIPSITWVLQGELFTQKVRLTLRPLKRLDFPRLNLFFTAARLPEGTVPQIGKDGYFRMEVENIPALTEESFKPPEEELRMRVRFFYGDRDRESPEAFWKREGKEWNKIAEDFMNRRSAMERAVQQIVDASDSPDTKLRKLYGRVQQIRNLSYERPPTEAEIKRQGLKENESVEDVLSRGYGTSTALTRLFVALARAARFDASIVRVSTRDKYFFDRQLLDWLQLNDEVASVRVANEELFLDPGTKHCPFGMLSWENSGVQGVRLDKDGGAFVTTSLPRSQDSATERQADLRLLEDGALEGRLVVTFTGQEALAWRLEAHLDDRLGADKKIKEEIEKWLPSGASVMIEKSGSWDSAEEPLRIEAKIRVPGFASAVGQRLLIPSGLFHSRDAHPFSRQERVYPVYFEFPYQQRDAITISLSEQQGVEAMPGPMKVDLKAVQYTTEFEHAAGKLVLRRHLLVEGFMFRQEAYAVLRAFYDRVRTGDSAQIVLQARQGQ